EFTFALDEVTGILVRAWGGDDTVVADSSGRAFTDTVPTTFLGGDGDDTLIGSFGAQRLEGGAGADLLDGHRGADTLLGGDGDDTVTWASGDGSDVVVGGAGADRLTADGSDLEESYEVTA